MTDSPDEGGIAIIGMAVRLPGADTPEAFWRNVRDGIESITLFSADELIAAGVDPSLVHSPLYVKASPILHDVDCFDAGFFGYSPKEATVMDPQHRLFLETCWAAVEDAGYDPETLGSRATVGVFAGAGSALTSYFAAYSAHPAMQTQTAGLAHITNDKDFLSTRVSYKLNLTGPSLTVQTACSTSLVAVHLACQSLQAGECDVALAGASTIRIPHIRGYLAERGSVHATDGHCRPFDAAASGTIFGSGVAAILLKPVAAAVGDHDHIYATIKGSAVNNDGAAKVSYTAASVAGQARAMIEALAMAQVGVESIGYVECHATGTLSGDPVEIQALSRAFRSQTTRKALCAIGSVKANIGHPEQTAGVAALIKTALALERGAIPPNRHLVSPNPQIDFAGSPFWLPTGLAPWPEADTPRRAGVNSLGIGGTNAFVVLEQAPPGGVPIGRDGPTVHTFAISAKTPSALRTRARQFADYLASEPGMDLADICFTAATSRSRFAHRLAFACATVDELHDSLRGVLRGGGTGAGAGERSPHSVVFLFSGQGAQYAGMSRDLYRTNAVFREALDRCGALLQPHLDLPLVELLAGPDETTACLHETRYTQPALVAVEYALAQVWQSWGVRPAAVIGHSVGEIAAACVAGALDLPDAIAFAAARGRLMHQISERGAMAAFFADEATVRRAIDAVGGQIDVAALNGPNNTVVSGEPEALDRVSRLLGEAGVTGTRLQVSQAFHSPLIEPALEPLTCAAAGLASRPPRIPWMSTLTGAIVSEAPTAHYWRSQARQPVRFHDGLRAVAALGHATFIEVGPGTGLVGLGRHCIPDPDAVWLASLRKGVDDTRAMCESLARVYVAGTAVDWDQVYEPYDCRRVPLPTYPFERQRFWLDTMPVSQGAGGRGAADPRRSGGSPALNPVENGPLSDHLYRLAWKPHPHPVPPDAGATPGHWLIFGDDRGVGDAVAAAIEQSGGTATLVHAADRLARVAPHRWTVNPGRKADFGALLRQTADEREWRGVAFLWGLNAAFIDDMTLAGVVDAEVSIVRPALFLVQGLLSADWHPQPKLWFVTRGAQCAGDDEPTSPVPALLWGLGRTVGVEAPRLWGGSIDLSPAAVAPAAEAPTLLSLLLGAAGEQQIAVRRDGVRVARLEGGHDTRVVNPPLAVRPDATYLVTGGLGQLGLHLARWLVETKGARSLVLTGRRGPTAEVRRALADLGACGARVRVLDADVSVEDDVLRALDTIDRELSPLRGIVHGAGVLADGVLQTMEWDAFTRATAPKMRGAWLLDHHTRARELDFMILQSSLLSLTGSGGQANYAAANAFLDAMAAYRRSHGRPTLAINWGPWEIGMAVSSGSHAEARWRARGMRLISPEFGSRALTHVFDRPVGDPVVAWCEWATFAAQFAAPPKLLDGLVQTDGHPAAARRPPPDFASRLATAPAGSVRAMMVEALEEQIRGELGYAAIATTQPLKQLGVDSLMSVNLANRLETSLGLRVPVATLIQGPSIEALADDLLRDLIPDPPAPADLERGSPALRSEGPCPVMSAGDGWLVRPGPAEHAALRLFCFNFAGGGAGPFRPWAELLDPGIELVAIEPPGHGSRIQEPPLTSLESFVEALLRALRPELDRPCAFFGHCLGALTLFEAARQLLSARAIDLVHVFTSGARPPHRVTTQGRFEEDLLAALLGDPDFDALRPFHDQPDETFARILRHFNIWATDDFLRQPELRTLLLPAVRADFAMASRYRFRPTAAWDVPITCFNGLDDPYVTRDEALEWSRYTNSDFRIHFRRGNHFLVVEDRDFIISAINRELSARRHAATPVA